MRRLFLNDIEKVLIEALKLMDLDQKQQLYEMFNGGTYSTSQFKDWLYKDVGMKEIDEDEELEDF